MSDKLLAGHEPFSMYQRSTAALIVALLCELTFCLAVSLDTVTRGTIMAAMMPRIVTTASSSIKENAARLRWVTFFMLLGSVPRILGMRQNDRSRSEEHTS